MMGMLPGDVRRVIDRADEKMGVVDERLAVIGDLISEQNSLLTEQNRLLRQIMKRSAVPAANGTPRAE